MEGEGSGSPCKECPKLRKELLEKETNYQQSIANLQ